MHDDYPTVASAEPVVPSDEFFYVSSFEEGQIQYLAEEAEKEAQLAARIQKERRAKKAETAIECWKRISEEKHLKTVKSAKLMAKKAVKAKELHRLRLTFPKNNVTRLLGWSLCFDDRSVGVSAGRLLFGRLVPSVVLLKRCLYAGSGRLRSDGRSVGYSIGGSVGCLFGRLLRSVID